MRMYLRRAGKKPAGSLSLTQQVGLLSLAPVVALGLILAHVLTGQIVSRTLADASRSAQLIARVGIQPRLTPHDLRYGLSTAGVRALDGQLSVRSASTDLARIKIWNRSNEVIYSDDHALIGRTLPPSDELENALGGKPNSAAVVNPRPHSETAAEVGLGQLVEVYVPLRFSAGAAPAGAFEIYLSYRPIAAAIARDKRTIALVVSIGLALLWTILFRIVARAAGRLRRKSEENYRLARYDQLTGLPNRTSFLERLAAARSQRAGRRGVPAVLLIDLDNFREINNTLGSSTGDHVLRETARRLQRRLGEHALVARLGGDDFALLCPSAEGVPGALASAAAVQACLEPPILQDGVALTVDASIGIAVCGEDGEDLPQLLQRADAALARAKSQRSRVEVFSPARDSFDPSRLLLLGEARVALERDQFVLHYQPKVELTSMEVTGVEALVRWQHPRRGLLSPMTFIPLLEQTALMAPLTLHVLTQALAQQAAWRGQGLDIGVSVNLSARNLLDPNLTGLLAGLLRRYEIPPSGLTVEITESAAMSDSERAAEALDGLRALGVRISIDDFGTGNTSIASLARLRVSEIKIDRSFIDSIYEDRRAQAIVRSTIDLARHLDLHVVAEGIETQATLERVRELGCDTAQGYLIARPLSAEELTPFIGEGARQRRPRTRSEEPVRRPRARQRQTSGRASS
jgi:diguanylate cyclase (GGDEF)-like protein